jgi:hypothetical protein
MAAMAQAAMAEMRQSRNPMPSPMKGMPPKKTQMAESKGGAGSEVGGPQGAVPGLLALKPGDWGKLPPKLAEDLNKAKSEAVPGDYREAVETYYRVIAEKSKKP